MSLTAIETLIRRTLEGDQANPLLYRAGKARGVLVAIHSRLTKARNATDTVLTNVRQAGGCDGPAPSAGDSVPRSGLPITVGRLADRLPVRVADDDPVTGFLVTADGSAVRVLSGRNRDTVSDLKPR